SKAKTDCGTGCGPADPAQKERSDALGLATVSTVTTAVAGGALATGAIIWFLAPRAKTSALRAAPLIGPSVAGAGVSGTF
ncbi:MAG: hypothetical protein JO173_03820, partial [Gammaproteobacteria bacterium]|nr:hypothetical protein [Gammaproteobacteria bacterium]